LPPFGRASASAAGEAAAKALPKGLHVTKTIPPRWTPPAVNGQLGTSMQLGTALLSILHLYPHEKFKSQTPTFQKSKPPTSPDGRSRPPRRPAREDSFPFPVTWNPTSGERVRGWSLRSRTSRRAHAASPPTRASSPSP
jgi:hypothetical protein